MDFSASCTLWADNVFGPQAASCRQAFDFTLLFEQSILSVGPSAILLLLLPVRAVLLYQQGPKTLPNRLHTAKLASISVFGCLQVTLLVLWAASADEQPRASIPAACLSVLDACSLAVLSGLEHKRAIRPSMLISIYLLFSIILDVAQARTLWLRAASSTIAGLFTAGVALKTFILVLETFEKRSFLRAPYRAYPPEALGGVLNTTIFWWINSLLRKGYRAVIVVDDLFDTDEALTSDTLGKTLLSVWARQGRNGRYALLRAILLSFNRPLLALVFPRLCLIGFRFSQPLLINRAISMIEAPEYPSNANIGYGLIGATGLIYVGLAISTATYKHKIYRLITMLHGGLVCLIYDTTLKIDSIEAGKLAAVTLMSTDIERIGAGFISIDSLWAGPIEAGIAIYLLELQLGPACIAPVIVAMACTTGAFSIMKWAKNSQKEWVEVVQKRIVMTASTLNSIQGLKMQGLTERISSDLQALRIQELEYAKRFRRNIIFTAGVSNVTALCGPVLTFAVYIIITRATSGVSLNIAQTFTSLSLISLLSTPVSELVQTIPIFAAAMGCFDRIQTYIKTDVLGDQRILMSDSDEPPVTSRVPVAREIEEGIIEPQDNRSTFEKTCNRARGIAIMENASIGYTFQGANVLNDINLEISPCSLTMVTGLVGCGKSTLLKALLGELPTNKGLIKTSMREIAYCAQDAWLPNISLREIVLGGSVYDETWYNSIFRACALDQDILKLSNGDQTIVGSKGGSLSGGQKQRLALARAIYARKQLILLDNVLSGLDARTDNAVFQQVLGPNGLCARHGFSVVLVTHNSHHLGFAENIIVLGNDRSILEQGNFEQLRSGKGRIHELLVQRSLQGDANVPSTSADSALKAEPPPKKSIDLTRRSGDMSIYLYLARSVGWPLIVLFFGTVALYVLASELQAVLLELWSAAETSHPGLYTDMYLGLYGILAGLAVLGLVGLFCVMLLFACPKSSIRLHKVLLDTVMAAPYCWFTATDSGVTLNRFSQDMSLIDMDLLVCLVDTVVGTFMATAEAVLIVIGAKWAALAFPFIVAILYLLQSIYLRTSRQLRFLDLETKSPLYSNFMETLAGLSTIRAFGWQEVLAQRNRELLDVSQRPFHLLYCTQRWLCLVLDLIVAGIAVLLMVFATQMRATTSGGGLGVALVNVLNFNTTLTFLINKWTALETSIGAVSRVKNFELNTILEHLESEIEPSPEQWPSAGKIEFTNVSAVYNRTTPPVLQDISFVIEAGQKVGIVGRTGSGKSSLLLTLLRMLDLSAGSISIDNVPLSDLRRQALRAALVTIPQEAHLLSGSVRFNVDPFSSLSDAVAEVHLRKVGLWEAVAARGGLDAPMDAMQLSQGQQQLFSVARALCRKAALGDWGCGVLLLDEATSDVDVETEAYMLQVLEEEFRGWTVLAVVHRLRALRGYDRVLVLEEGRVVEEGVPEELIERPEGRYRQLWETQCFGTEAVGQL
ncbi:hypothetical protein MMC26_005396 [Xylographa opegraphella]|nr:hypothetical protein [Xylographa opegraphella]